MIYSLPTPVNWTLVLWVQEPQRRQGNRRNRRRGLRSETKASVQPGNRVCRRKCVMTALADATDQSEERVGKMSL
jgi:hypothetical protein